MVNKATSGQKLKAHNKLGQDGRYIIEKHIGSGGMGDVYLAYDALLNRQVALKVLVQSKIIRGEERDRFFSEARVLANLRHENLVPVYELDFDKEPIFIVQRFLPGGDLDKFIEDGQRMKKRQAWQLIYDLANALAYLHENRIVHRDIKPANILFDEAGRAFLSDFGLVRELDATRFTETQALVGTPLFVVPEVLDGANHEMAGDIFQFGLVVHYALTGNHRYCKAESFHKYVLALSDGNESELLDDTELPSPFDELVAHCCQANPHMRLKNGTALLHYIEQLPRDPTITIDKGTREERLKKPKTTTKSNAKIATIALSVFFLLFLWVLWANFNATSENRYTLAQKIRDKVFFPDGLYLVLPKVKPDALTPSWKLFTLEQKLLSQGAFQSTTAGFALELNELPKNFKGNLVIEDGKAVGKVAVELPNNVLKEPVQALFGRHWFKLSWQLHGKSCVQLKYQVGSKSFLRTIIKNNYRREFGNDLRKEKIQWQLLHGKRLLASGRGKTGLRPLTRFSKEDLFGKNITNDLLEPAANPMLHDDLLWVALEIGLVFALDINIHQGRVQWRFANREYLPQAYRSRTGLKFMAPAGKNKVITYLQKGQRGIILPIVGRKSKAKEPPLIRSVDRRVQAAFAKAYGDKTYIALYDHGQIELLSYDHKKGTYKKLKLLRADSLRALETNKYGTYLCYKEKMQAKVALIDNKGEAREVAKLKAKRAVCSYSSDDTAVFVVGNVATIVKGTKERRVSLDVLEKIVYFPPISLDDEERAILISGIVPKRFNLVNTQRVDMVYLPLHSGKTKHYKLGTTTLHAIRHLLKVGPARYKDKLYLGVGSHLQTVASQPPFDVLQESFTTTTLKRVPIIFKQHVFIAVKKGNFYGLAVE